MSPAESRWFVVLSVLGLGAASTVGQGEAAGERARVFGRVLTKEGSPWKGATVTLVGRPYPVYLHAGKVDEVVARANERGRFVARILPYRRYSAWAHARMAGGGGRVSRIVDEVMAGVPLQLVERDEPVLRTRVRFENLETLDRYAPLRFRAYCRRWPGTALGRFLDLDDNREAEVPLLPYNVIVEIVGKGGVRLWGNGIPTTARGRVRFQKRSSDYLQGARQDPDRPDVSIIRVPDVTPLEVQVVTPQKEPILGATIALGYQDSSGWVGDVFDCAPVATTGPGGLAVVPWSFHFRADGSLGAPRPSVHVTAPGHSEVFLRHMGGSKPPIRRDQTRFTLTLPSGASLIRGRLVGADDEPLANVDLLLYGSVGSFTAPKPFVYRTRRDGRFLIPSVASSLPCRLTALLPGESHPVVVEEAYLHFVPEKAPQENVDLGTVHTGKLPRVEFRVTDPDGKPSDRAWVHVGETAPNGPRQTIVLRTDRKGVVRLRARPGVHLSALATNVRGFATKRLQVPESRTSCELAMKPGCQLAGRVVDGKGKPIPGATVRIFITGLYDSAEPWGSFFWGVFRTSPALKGILRTDSKGAFAFASPAAGVRIQVQAWKTTASGTELGLRERMEFLLGEEGATDLELQLVPRK